MDPRAIDPTRCWLRHVRRGTAGQLSAQQVGAVYFVRADTVDGADGLNGEQGWQQAETTLVLSDDGTFKVTFPNSAGDDGILHRRRFKVLTDDTYEPGEEWIEVWSDARPDQPLFVGTPTDYTKSPSQVGISGADLTAVLAGSYTTDVDVWDSVAPADLIRHYGRLRVLAYGGTALGSIVGAAAAWGSPYTQTLAGVATDAWVAEARLRVTSARPAAAGASFVRIWVGATKMVVDLFDGAVNVGGAPERNALGKRLGLMVPGDVTLRVVSLYDRIFCFVEGELIAEYRQLPPWPAVPDFAVYAFGTGTTAAIDEMHFETLTGFATRGPSTAVERHLPGIPPAVGLRARYYNAAPVYAQNTTRDGRLARLWPLVGGDAAAVDRIDPTVNFTTGAPPNMPGAYAARWSGAIYLDLAAADRKVRLSSLVGNARLYIGRTLRGDEAATSWVSAAGTTPITTGALRAWLGESVAGWFPVLIEQAHDTAAYGIVLEDTALDGAGAPIAWGTVPQARLSPYGTFDDLIRLESHRQVIGDVARDFGYQWRVDPRSLESGEFPGSVQARAQVGRPTAETIDDSSVGTEIEVTGAAGDVVDGLLADAAGTADPAGAGQLTAQTIDYPRASTHLALRQAYESLAEISDPALLAIRLDSLLALRSSPNEQVGARPLGQVDLVDPFPLIGAASRLDWEPGDAALLDLDSIDVSDTTPRQMTSVQWSPRPDGRGVPTVGWRQRPRSPRAAMQRLVRAIYGPQRNYQGSFAVVTGSPGGVTSAGAAVTGHVDGYSRCPLPAALDDVAAVTVVVRALSGTGWRLEVTGVDLGATDGAVGAVGRYDVTRAAKASAAGTPSVYARLIGGASGQYEITLEVRVRV